MAPVFGGKMDNCTAKTGQLLNGPVAQSIGIKTVSYTVKMALQLNGRVALWSGIKTGGTATKTNSI
jgi:hypothetical protein